VKTNSFFWFKCYNENKESDNMKTVVITGSARGLGLEMAKLFRQANLNIVISDLKEENLKKAKKQLEELNGEGNIEYCVCNVTYSEDIQNLIDFTIEKFEQIDIWINNAGVNQPDKPIWELTKEEIDLVLDVDLKGAIMGSQMALKEMSKKHSGAIYNIEGYGSNDAMMTGLSIYGTSKRAITYFTQALAKEANEKDTGVIIGRLSPGIMITDFITNALGNKEKIELPEKTKKVYNILGDYPDVVAKFLVDQMLNNKKNNAHIEWLTNSKAAWRFMTSVFNKRNFFN
jgi:NAD(P)-dependent dehydrogenase (short-subunit alcohol dehydrogenase family)